MSRSAIRCLQYMGSLPRTRRCCCFKQSRSFSYSQKRATVPPFLVCSCCISVWWVKLLRKRGNFFQRLLSVNRTSLLVLIYAFVFLIFFLIPFALFLLYICFVLFFPPYVSFCQPWVSSESMLWNGDPSCGSHQVSCRKSNL